jgi:hypothetical protein
VSIYYVTVNPLPNGSFELLATSKDGSLLAPIAVANAETLYKKLSGTMLTVPLIKALCGTKEQKIITTDKGDKYPFTTTDLDRLNFTI